MLDFELVLPAYNEAKSLKAIVSRTAAAAREASFSPSRFQLLLVNNGSTDESRGVLSDLQKTDLGEWFKAIHVENNQGYGHGLWQGLQQTTAPIVGWSHADQQCEPADVFRAYEVLKKHPTPKTLIKGTRLARDKKNAAVSRIFEIFARVILGLKVNEVNAQPKIFHRGLLSVFSSPPKTFAFDLYALFMACKNGYRIESISVNFPNRVHGLSRWSATLIGRTKTILGMILFMFKLVKKEGRLCER